MACEIYFLLLHHCTSAVVFLQRSTTVPSADGRQGPCGCDKLTAIPGRQQGGWLDDGVTRKWLPRMVAFPHGVAARNWNCQTVPGPNESVYVVVEVL